MFSLAPMGDLTRFRRSSFKNEVYLVTEDICIKSNGVLLAARSAKIAEMLEKSENIPAVEFSDDIAGLEDCLNLVYGGSVDIRLNNCNNIYKFGKLFQMHEMMEGVLAWIANDMTYDKFWRAYLYLKNLHEDISVYVDIITGYLSADGGNFVKHTTEICRSQDKTTITAVLELLSRIDDIRVLSVMENIIDTSTENKETVANTASSTDNNYYLQEIVSSVVTFIENYLKSDSCDESSSYKARCKQTLQKAASVCMSMKTLRTIITKISLYTSFQPSPFWIITAQSIKDLNWERVEQLTSPTTPYEAIRYFTENAGTEIHPIVVVEIVIKWWSVGTDREHVDMSFIKPLITTIENVNSSWYDSVRDDERYKGLIKTLDIPEPAAPRAIYYTNYSSRNNELILKDCIRKGDGTPSQLEDLRCTKNMERYRQSVFRYNAAVFPLYGDTKYHWFIRTYTSCKHVSLITNSKDEVLNYIDDSVDFYLNFVPLPDS